MFRRRVGIQRRVCCHAVHVERLLRCVYLVVIWVEVALRMGCSPRVGETAVLADNGHDEGIRNTIEVASLACERG